MSARDLMTSHHGLYRSILLHFGSLDAAREAAEVPARHRHRVWTAQKVIDELQTLDRAGMRITEKNLRASSHKPLTAAVRAYFGTFRKARAAAGIKLEPRLERPRRQWDQQVVVEAIRARHAKGRSLAASRVDSDLASAAYFYFGSWEKAVTAAGFDYDEIRIIRPAHAIDDVLEAIRQLATTVPQVTPRLLWDKVPTLKKFYAGPREAAEAAGIDNFHSARPPLMSRDEVITELRSRVEHNLAVTTTAANCPSRLKRSVYRRFPTWTDALLAAGLPVPNRRSWTSERVVEELRAVAERNDDVARNLWRIDSRLWKACIRYFGSIAAACEAAGIDPHWQP